MNVKYLALGTVLQGPVIERLGSVVECADQVPWLLAHPGDFSVFLVRSGDGEGVVVAGSIALDESDASASDPSRFFMME